MGSCDTAKRPGLKLESKTNLDSCPSSTTCLTCNWEIISTVWGSVFSSEKWHLQYLPHGITESLLQIIYSCSWHCACHRVAFSKEQNLCICCCWGYQLASEVMVHSMGFGGRLMGLCFTYELCDLSQVTVSLNSVSSSERGKQPISGVCCED